MNQLRRPVPPPMAVRLKIFVSHSWRYGDHRLGIHELLEQEWRKDRDFVDLAVPADHPIHDTLDDADLFDRIRDRIARADVFLVLGGMYANSSDWIEPEVSMARALGVPVITVVPYGQERVASAATRFADCRVGWRGSSIRRAILDFAPSDKAAEIRARVNLRSLAKGPAVAVAYDRYRRL
jgi:hypothetical protein